MAAKQDYAQKMKRTPKILVLVAIILVLTACKTDTVRKDISARIVEPTPESRAELQRVVSGALNVKNVTIADDALTRDSLLIIEPRHLMGRDHRKPEHFRLILSDSACILVHQGVDIRYELTHTVCTAEGT